MDYDRDIRPVLASHCYACHGPDPEKRKGKLRLDRPVGSPTLVEIIRRVTSRDDDDRMPPPGKGRPLSPDQVAYLRRWIDEGTPRERHWSLIPPRRPPPPSVVNSAWPRNGVDPFILSRLERQGIRPSPEADRATLLRRLSLDLLGLPPSPGEVADFTLDGRPDAYERRVDRFLASPHFGERIGRTWLDLARYADSDGYETDQARPYAWRYRQWVIDSFNRDLPFDQFTIEQVAGDLLPGATVEQKIATGFHRNTLSNREGGADLEEYRVEQVVDRVSTLGTTWLGLTVGCARCHDHKFDPISQEEFFRLFAFLNSAEEVNIEAPLAGELGSHLEARPAFEKTRQDLLGAAEPELSRLQARWEEGMRDAFRNPGRDARWDRSVELLGLIWRGGQLEGLSILLRDAGRRTPRETDRLRDYFLKQGSFVYPREFKEHRLSELSSKLEKLAASLPKLSEAPVLAERPEPRPTTLHLRGDFRRAGAEVGPGTPAVLPPLEVKGRPSRLDLARWLVSPRHPLTARVAVNRVWQELFGRGLVATSDDFGVRGDSPSHPELLDWLAAEFQSQGWGVKRLYRLIVTSATYRQSSRARPETAARDPDNRLLGRQNRLRLHAENVRDAALAVSGLLHPAVGGPSVRPPQAASVVAEGHENTWVESRGPDRYRRGTYTWIQRTTPFAQSVTFDGADPSRCTSRRERTNGALQALTLLNDPVFFEASRALAERTLREERDGPLERIRHAFRSALARDPTEREMEVLLRYWERRGDWVELASVLLNLDEFITRE